MRRIIILISLIFIFSDIYCQQGDIIPGSFAPGGATSAYKGRWQPFRNPSAASLTNKIAISAAYENKYITKELSNKLISIVIPTNVLNITAAFNHFGYSVYNEMLAGVGVSRDFGRWRLGVEADIYTVYLSPTERYAVTATANIGAQVDVSKRVTLGFSMFNPVFSSVKSAPKQYLPVVLAIGMNYRLHDKVDWLVEIDKEIRSLFHWKTGFEYRPFDVLSLRLGIYGSDYVIPTIGLGFLMSDFGFDLHCEINPRLGVTLLGALHYDI